MLSLTSTVIALGMSSLCLGSVIPSVKRQVMTPNGCNSGPFGTGIPLVVRPVGQGYNGPITYVGVVAGVKHEGIDGQQVSHKTSESSFISCLLFCIPLGFHLSNQGREWTAPDK
jgi:hypothetical protein